MARNEIVCVIGESGSGKSITVRAILGLLAQPHVRPVGGALRSWDENLLEATAARMRQGRGQAVAMVFQEPMTALNPLMTVGRQIGEMAAINKNLSRPARRETVLAMLEQIQLPNTGRIYCAYLPSRPCVGH
jgi:peptide/nickel transport system ATP-binding protein